MRAAAKAPDAATLTPLQASNSATEQVTTACVRGEAHLFGRGENPWVTLGVPTRFHKAF